jgi:hypothetical protein
MLGRLFTRTPGSATTLYGKYDGTNDRNECIEEDVVILWLCLAKIEAVQHTKKV